MAGIPFFSLTRQYKTIQKEIDAALVNIAAHGTFILGDNVAKFEKEFARYVGVGHAIGVGSGTDALTLSMRALGLTGKDEVLVPANSYPTVFGVALSGVSVRLVDCGLDGNISLTDLPKRMTKRTKAIIVVHLYGNPANISGLKKVLPRGMAIIEDRAQWHKRDSPLLGDIACYSFYPTKNLGAYGDGGMVVTDTAGFADRVRRLRMYGEVTRYKSIEVSGVSRLDELQAAVLRVKLRHLDRWNETRRVLALRYENRLNGAKVIKGGSGSCHHLFVIRTKRRDELQKFLADRGVGTAIHYPTTIHLTKAFRFLGYTRGDFPVAETLSREVLSLPLFPELTKKEIDQVVKSIKECIVQLVL